MPTEADLAAFRELANLRMKSTATIRRKADNQIPGPDGIEVPEWLTVHVGLPCRIGGSNAGSSGTRTESVDGVEYQVATRVAHFPVATTDLEDGDFIEVTAGETVGTVWRIVESDEQDQATARRLPVVAELRPEEWT